MSMPEGAAPEEGEGEPDIEMTLEELLGMGGDDEDEEEKPFGDEEITEDEAVEMDKK
jgi:hypothetical protein